MFINPKFINNIAIMSTQKPVSFVRFRKFIKKSPYIRRVAFIGSAIFDMPEFVEMVRFCAVNNIWLIFGEMGKTSDENIRALVEYKNVIAVNVHDDGHNVELLNEYKYHFRTELPEVNIIVKLDEERHPQDDISPDSYAFYNLADDIDHIACLKLLEEPLLDYNGDLIGCWQNRDEKHPVNAFDLGMEKAFNKLHVKQILKMLKTGKICKSCPCTRCVVFASLVWANKKIDLAERVFDES